MTLRELREQLAEQYKPADADELELMQYWAKTAIEVQDASSLVGVTHAYMTLVNELFPLSRQKGRGTQWLNNHPLIAVFVDKLRDMSTNHDEMGRLGMSFNWVFDVRDNCKDVNK